MKVRFDRMLTIVSGIFFEKIIHDLIDRDDLSRFFKSNPIRIYRSIREIKVFSLSLGEVYRGLLSLAIPVR
jgi:hypothetical protein